MRVHQAIAVVALILIGFGVKIVFFSPNADAIPIKTDVLGIDIAKMQENRNLPTQKLHDMSVVFLTDE